MNKGADIDKEEYHTGNTAIFLSALDLQDVFCWKIIRIKSTVDKDKSTINC